MMLSFSPCSDLAKCVKSSQSQDGVGELSSVRRSYTQELLDFGISFGGPNLQKNSTNPFITGKEKKRSFRHTAQTSDIDDVTIMKCFSIEFSSFFNMI